MFENSGFYINQEAKPAGNPRSNTRLVPRTTAEDSINAIVNTSSEANTSYMLKLQRLGFIKATEEREYITTAKGMLFLEKWNRLTELVKPDPNDIARRKPIPGKAG